MTDGGLGPHVCHRYDFLVCLIGTDLTFSNYFKKYFYSHLGLITTPHVLYVQVTYVYSLFFMFHCSHDHMAKRSHYHIMILYNFRVLQFGRIPTLILFYFLHNPTTPELPIYVNQQWSHLEKDTTWTQCVVIWKIPTVPRRTVLTPY